jgi:hypothetical protein
VEELTQNPEPIVPNSMEAKCGDYSPPWPWRNMSIWRLMRWKSTGSNLKSNAKVTRLVHDVLEAPDFDIQELSSFNASRKTSHFDAVEKEIPPEDVFAVDRWKRTSIDISVPTRENKKEGNGRTFSVDGVLYRPILDVIRAVFTEASSKTFHLTPFKWVWKSPVTVTVHILSHRVYLFSFLCRTHLLWELYSYDWYHCMYLVGSTSFSLFLL